MGSKISGIVLPSRSSASTLDLSLALSESAVPRHRHRPFTAVAWETRLSFTSFTCSSFSLDLFSKNFWFLFTNQSILLWKRCATTDRYNSEQVGLELRLVYFSFLEEKKKFLSTEELVNRSSTHKTKNHLEWFDFWKWFASTKRFS